MIKVHVRSGFDGVKSAQYSLSDIVTKAVAFLTLVLPALHIVFGFLMEDKQFTGSRRDIRSKRSV